MIKEGDLEVYDIELEVVTPVYIGSGIDIQPNEYLYDPRTRLVSIIDVEKLFEKVLERDALEDYERFASSTSKNLERFLKDTLKLNRKEIFEITQRRINSEDVSYRFKKKDNGDPSTQRIQSFVRDSHGNPYVPGSGIKGALRTAFLVRQIWDEKKGDESPLDVKKMINSFEKSSVIKAKDKKNRRIYNKDRLKKEAVFPEEEILNTLQFKEDSPLNDTSHNIMRGISISDSEPLSNSDIILIGKEDIKFDGTTRKKGKIPLVREALKPGTKIKAKLTLDQKILKHKVSKDEILDSIAAQSQYLTDFVDEMFKIPWNAFTDIPNDYLVLGGGTGFFNKTLNYLLYNNEFPIESNQNNDCNFSRAVTLVRNFLSDEFDGRGRADHKHRIKDKKISPHIKKYTRYKRRYYPMGYTKVTIK